VNWNFSSGELCSVWYLSVILTDLGYQMDVVYDGSSNLQFVERIGCGLVHGSPPHLGLLHRHPHGSADLFLASASS
jgi:hypothetical protein